MEILRGGSESDVYDRGGLTLIGIFAMRWNVVIGGQLFSKSFLGYTTYKMELVTREGLVSAIALMVLPFVIFLVLVKLLPPWQEERLTKPEEVAVTQPEWETLERDVRSLAERVAFLERHAGLSAPAAPPVRAPEILPSHPLAEMPGILPHCGKGGARAGRRISAACPDRVRHPAHEGGNCRRNRLCSAVARLGGSKPRHSSG